jgi:elongation factor P
VVEVTASACLLTAPASGGGLDIGQTGMFDHNSMIGGRRRLLCYKFSGGHNVIDVNELRKGTAFEMDGELYKVVEYQHYKPGRGKAIIRTKIRNLRTESTVDKNFISGDRVQDVRIDSEEVQYLYHDGDLYYFMNTTTYEQPALNATVLGDTVNYLVEGQTLNLSVYDGKPIDVELPTTVDLRVIEAPPGYAGDTASGATKQVITETGLKVTVPLFVNEGDVIRVDTRSGNYLTRA